MTTAFRVETLTPACGECGNGAMFTVIGPDEVAESTDFGDKEDADSLARSLNHAFELGQKDAPTISVADLWILFAPETPPPSGTALLVWDAEFSTISSMFCSDPGDALKRAGELKYSHWLVATRLPGPRNPPQLGRPVIPAAPPTSPPPTPTATTGEPDWTDDIPF
jgi:hypothetical protein